MNAALASGNSAQAEAARIKLGRADLDLARLRTAQAQHDAEAAAAPAPAAGAKVLQFAPKKTRAGKGRKVATGGTAAPVAEEPNAVPVPATARPVSGLPSTTKVDENGWGYAPDLPSSYHEDGPIGTALEFMGSDDRMDVDGQPLRNVLGRMATDVVMGRRHPQQALTDFKALRDRLPAGSRARDQLDGAISKMDGPDTPAPKIPAKTPEPLRKLVADLHSIPMVRRDPDKEMRPLLEIVKRANAGELGKLGLFREIQELANHRHESLGECGKMTIDRAILTAAKAFEPRRMA